MYDEIESKQGPITYLVNNAGIALPGDFLDTSIEQFRQVIDVNLVGVFACLQRAANALQKGVSCN